MNRKKIISNVSKIGTSLLLGGVILYWMYRDFDFGSVSEVLFHEMNWAWMLLSFPFGILAQLFRGLRWRMTLKPLDEHPRKSICVDAVFLSYATSLIIPRIGEFARCGILNRYDGVSFPKALGTVVTERAIDTLLVALITALTLLTQMNVFDTFFLQTGTNIENVLAQFSSVGYIVTIVCAVSILFMGWYLLRRFSIYNKVKTSLGGLVQGILSLRNVENVPMFVFYTLAIWASYFFHYYLTFFCFPETAHLGISCALVTFIVGSIAVIVPTPNGAGSWHFAVKTMLILYGVTDTAALYFVLIVHSIQTLLVVCLGLYAWIRLLFIPKKQAR